MVVLEVKNTSQRFVSPVHISVDISSSEAPVRFLWRSLLDEDITQRLMLVQASTAQQVTTGYKHSGSRPTIPW